MKPLLHPRRHHGRARRHAMRWPHASLRAVAAGWYAQVRLLLAMEGRL